MRAQSPEPMERRQARTDSGSGGEGTSGTAAASSAGESSASLSDDERRRRTLDHGEVTGYTKDWRNYHCKTWHLEPTVR